VRTSREVRLASRPLGWPTAENFELVEVDVPAPDRGQIVVRNLFMSVDPYMRGRMNDVKSYVPPFQVGAALDGGAVGEVVGSTSDAVKVGDVVLHGLGWREYAVLNAAHAKVLDPNAAPLSAYLGVLGMPGLTAYAGLLAVGEYKDGETVFVSGAAGAVGSLVGQFAKLRGSKRVIGSAGSAQKVKHLVEDLGFDAAFNYKDAPVAEQLAAAAPDGIDVYFDNVGGDHLEAAIGAANPFARLVECGMVSRYNDERAEPGPRNMAMIVPKRLLLKGFIVRDHTDRARDFYRDMGEWVRDGKVRYRETYVDGIENAPRALLGLFGGENIGKMLVRLRSA